MGIIMEQTSNGKSIFEMLNNQFKLNGAFLGKVLAKAGVEHEESKRLFDKEGWVAVASNHLMTDYRSAFLDEAVEFQRSDEFWKFWKTSSSPDEANMRIEYVDMLHFLMSETMAWEYIRLKAGKEDSLEDLEHSVVSGTAFCMEEGLRMNEFFREPIEHPQYEARSAMFGVLRTLFSFETSAAESKQALIDLSIMVWSNFWEMGRVIGFPFDQVLGVYRAKSVLNQFRIDNGDQTKSYQRMWQLSPTEDAQEDNYHLIRWHSDRVKTVGEPTREDIYSWMQKAYSNRFNK